MRALYHHRTQGKDVEAVHIHGMADGLRELGYAVEIVSPPGVTTDPNAGSVATPGKARRSPWGWIASRVPQVVFELMEIGYNAAALPRLLARCRGERPHLIYERYALYNAAGVLAGRLTGIPVVLEVNDTAHVDRTRQGKSLKMRGLAAWVEERIFRAADGIVVVSGYLRDQLVARGIDPEKVRVTHNAVDAARFDPDRITGDAVRQRWGLEGKTVVGFAGSFAKWHGVELLVRAFGQLAAEFPGARLLLVGDGARREQAEALVDELGIRDRVVFAGRVPHAAIPEHVAAMDLGVMPSSNLFGSPMKVFEYMAMGRPAVAPRYQPLEEAIDHGETGLLFEPENVDSLAGAIRTLLADPERRAACGRAARSRVLSRHLWVHNAETVVELASRRRGTRLRVAGGAAGEPAPLPKGHPEPVAQRAPAGAPQEVATGGH